MRKQVHVVYNFETKELIRTVITSDEFVAKWLSFATKAEDKSWRPQFKDKG
jgi:hypothetical protein